jgi:hypothetical protein
MQKPKFRTLSTALLTGVLSALSAVYAADAGADPGNATAIVTVNGERSGKSAGSIIPGNLVVYAGKMSARVTSIQPLESNSLKTQLFIYLDDSTSHGGFDPLIPELKSFVTALPPNFEVAIGYMRNGSYNLVQPFTLDHNKASSSVRLPISVPGINGSPYFALSYLVKHWPSGETVDRRAVLMLTDGVDRYYSDSFSQDPYVDAAIKDSQHFGVVVSSVYFRGAGFYAERGFGQTMSQSRLIQVAAATGGQAYFEGFNSPVSLTPYLRQFTDRLNRQYRVTFLAKENTGLQRVQFRSEVPGVTITGPTEVLIRNGRS